MATIDFEHINAPKLNVAVFGASGGIGAALVDSLQQAENIDQILTFSRQPQSSSSGCHALHFDAADPNSHANAFAEAAQQVDKVHLVINCIGILHQQDSADQSGASQQPVKPEKSLRQITLPALQQVFLANTFTLPVIATGMQPLLKHQEGSIFGSISARVGSITDNNMGGWYSYRASKAAHNMLLKTISLEWKHSLRHTICVALHPGTTRTRLSTPYISDNYPNRVLTPAESAQALLQVMSRLTISDSGRFFAWDGKQIPW